LLIKVFSESAFSLTTFLKIDLKAYLDRFFIIYLFAI